MNIKNKKIDKFGLLRKRFKELHKSCEFQYDVDDEDESIVCKDYLFRYQDKNYIVINLLTNEIIFQTKTVDRVADWLWKNVLVKYALNEIKN